MNRDKSLHKDTDTHTGNADTLLPLYVSVAHIYIIHLCDKRALDSILQSMYAHTYKHTYMVGKTD